jgi:hypothetical protein
MVGRKISRRRKGKERRKRGKERGGELPLLENSS